MTQSIAAQRRDRTERSRALSIAAWVAIGLGVLGAASSVGFRLSDGTPPPQPPSTRASVPGADDSGGDRVVPSIEAAPRHGMSGAAPHGGTTVIVVADPLPNDAPDARARTDSPEHGASDSARTDDERARTVRDNDDGADESLPTHPPTLEPHVAPTYPPVQLPTGGVPALDDPASDPEAVLP